MLEAVGLHTARDKYPHQLAGGTQRRLSIAQSVICKPKLLLLHEPFAVLDPGIPADMHEIILQLWQTNQMTIFMITHDLKESFQLGTPGCWYSTNVATICTHPNVMARL